MENVNNAENLPDLSLLNEDFANGVSEMEKCKQDPVYFIEEYGTVNGHKIILRDYQREMIRRAFQEPQIMQGLYPLQRSHEQTGSNPKLLANLNSSKDFTKSETLGANGAAKE